jgi:hypothetical protein
MEYASFSLQPAGFFDRSPAVNTAPSLPPRNLKMQTLAGNESKPEQIKSKL